MPLRRIAYEMGLPKETVPHLSRESSLQSRARHSPMFLATPPGRCCMVPGTEPPFKSVSPSQGFACMHPPIWFLLAAISWMRAYVTDLFSATSLWLS